jgi:hypothetical protein
MVYIYTFLTKLTRLKNINRSGFVDEADRQESCSGIVLSRPEAKKFSQQLELCTPSHQQKDAAFIYQIDPLTDPLYWNKVCCNLGEDVFSCMSHP